MSSDPIPPLLTPPPTSPQTSTLRKVFAGPNGIRAGWRLLIFYAIVFGLFAVLFGILHVLHIGGPRSSISQLTQSPMLIRVLIQDGTILLFTVIAALIMARIEHRRFSEYGFRSAGVLGMNFGSGYLWGFIGVTVLAIFAMHGFHVIGLGIHWITIVASTLAWSGTFLLVGMSEEFAFRGYPQFTLASGIGFWPAAFILSALFALVHLDNERHSAFGLVSIFIFGLLFCLFLRRTGNLWFPIGFHAGWDWGESFFYRVPDSGMLRVFTPIVLLIVAIIFSRLYREGTYPVFNTSQPANNVISGGSMRP